MEKQRFEKQRMERKLPDHRGITLVEIIIVIAIIGIMASTAVMMIGHLHYADTQKVVKTIDASMDQLQMKSISKSGKYYLYVYHLKDGYYVKILSENLTSFDGTKLTKGGTKISNNSIDICKGTDPLAENDYMKIAYTKQAVFDSANTTVQPGSADPNVQKLTIDGVPKYGITLVMDTGKHFITTE